MQKLEDNVSAPVSGEPTLEPGVCPMGCDPSRRTVLFDAPSDTSGEWYSVKRCDVCDSVFLDPRPALGHLLKYYDSSYYGPNNTKFDPATEQLVATFVWWRGKVLRRFMPPGGRVLDVGCGRGNFMAVMAARGFEVYGTELSTLSATRAQSLFGDRVQVGELQSCSFEPGTFDLITLWHVLEHVRDPRGDIARAVELLRPGGVLVLAQPNFDSLQAKLGRHVWFHLDVPRHLYHFSPRTLSALVTRCGLQPIKTSQWSIEQNPYGLLQSALSRAGAGHNSLYRVLKSEPGSPTGWRRTALLAAYYALMPVAVALSSIESTIGKGGSFYLASRKPLTPAG